SDPPIMALASAPHALIDSIASRPSCCPIQQSNVGFGKRVDPGGSFSRPFCDALGVAKPRAHRLAHDVPHSYLGPAEAKHDQYLPSRRFHLPFLLPSPSLPPRPPHP